MLLKERLKQKDFMRMKKENSGIIHEHEPTNVFDNLSFEGLSLLVKVIFDKPILVIFDNNWLNIFDENKNIKYQGNWFDGLHELKVKSIKQHKLVVSVKGYNDEYLVDISFVLKNMI